MSPGSPRSHARTPAFEHLERRQVLAATVTNGVLEITGSNQDDQITLAAGPGNGQVVVTGVPDVANGTIFDGVESVDVRLGNGNDTFTLSNNLFNPAGGSVDLTLNAGNGSDNVTLFNSLGGIQVRGGNGADNLTGGGAADNLFGGNGRDTLRGGANNDTLTAGNGRDLLVGGPGDDNLLAGQGNDELWGNAGLDILRGGKQRDLLAGGADLDQLFGDLGRDTFLGSPEEADDFGPQDNNFDPLFNPSGFGVLPNNTFWARFSGTEENGVTEDEPLTFAQVILNAFPQALAPYRAVVDDIFLMSPADRQTAFQALLAVTNVFSPTVLANPGAFTIVDLTNFRDELNAAAPNIGNFRNSFTDYNNALFDILADSQGVSPGIIATINDLEANAPETQAALFGADSLFNLLDELTF